MDKYRKRFFSAVLNEEQGTADFVVKVNKELGVPFHFIDDVEDFVRSFSKELIINEGISQFLKNGLILEQVLPPTKEPFLLVKTIKEMLFSLQPIKSLTIIDRYLFPRKSDEDYLKNLEYLILPFSKNTLKLTFVVGKNSNVDLLNQFLAKFNSSNTNNPISIITTDDYHDRFWVVDGEKGLFIGTSLNGVGKKYAIVDYLNHHDAIEIFNSVKQLA